MEYPGNKNNSDDDHSLPIFRLNAVTEALLARPSSVCQTRDRPHPPDGKPGQVRSRHRTDIPHSPGSLAHMDPFSSDRARDLLRTRPKRLPKQVEPPPYDIDINVPNPGNHNGPGVVRSTAEHGCDNVLTKQESKSYPASRFSLPTNNTAGIKQQHEELDKAKTTRHTAASVHQHVAERFPLLHLDKYSLMQTFANQVGQKIPCCRESKLESPAAFSKKQSASPPIEAESELRDAAAADTRCVVLEKRRNDRRVVINGHSYMITRNIGKGGSGYVFEATSASNRIWALKLIPLQTLDSRRTRQTENEVALLQSLQGAERVIFLKDWAIDDTKNVLHMVMEMGQLDFQTVIREHNGRNAKLDLVFVGYYWLEMLQCVASIHELNIVHSDIKPANFVLVNGVLKLVDFGIANTLPDGSVNVCRDHQAGTSSYMAPEALKLLRNPGHINPRQFVRFGRPSDMWSLGCVLYQMIYGKTPFGHVKGLVQRRMAIANPANIIEFNIQGRGGQQIPEPYIHTMKACLSREPAQRATAAGLLAQSSDGLLRHPERKTGKTVSATPKIVQDMVCEALMLQDKGGASREDINTLTMEVMGQIRRVM